ncbi:guanylate cyclase domain-containing protein, partial [Haematococcus lacustris]
MDIAGFTAMSKDVPAEEVIIFLNILFSRFDMLVESHGVQKVRCQLLASAKPRAMGTHPVHTSQVDTVRQRRDGARTSSLAP